MLKLQARSVPMTRPLNGLGVVVSVPTSDPGSYWTLAKEKAAQAMQRRANTAVTVGASTPGAVISASALRKAGTIGKAWTAVPSDRSLPVSGLGGPLMMPKDWVSDPKYVCPEGQPKYVCPAGCSRTPFSQGMIGLPIAGLGGDEAMVCARPLAVALPTSPTHQMCPESVNPACKAECPTGSVYEPNGPLPYCRSLLPPVVSPKASTGFKALVWGGSALVVLALGVGIYVATRES